MSRQAFEKGVRDIVESSQRAGKPIPEQSARKLMQDGARMAERQAKETGRGILAKYRDGERS